MSNNECSIHSIDEKKKAAYALNLCTVSISQIIDYNDINVLEQEYNMILNNLNLEQIPKDQVLLDVLKKILDTITFFRISEGDRVMIDHEYQNRMRTAIWSAVPSVGTIFATSNPAALGFTLATQVGIGYMNYRRNRSEYQLGKEKAEWQLKRSAMDQLNGLRSELFGTAWNLAKKYEFPDDYRLTAQQIEEYNKILLDENVVKRFNKLYAIKDKFDAFPPFWYQLGSTANNIYRNDELNLGFSKKEQYRQYAIDAFDKYNELNRYNILRHDILTSSWALEYIDLLDLTLDSEKQRALTLIPLAEKYSGNEKDILELCAFAYLKVGDKKNAARILYTLVNNDYNIAVNAKVLSAIYIQNMRNEKARKDALDEYKMLTLIADSRYILPIPSADIDLDNWMPGWGETIERRYKDSIDNRDFSALESLIGNRYKISEDDEKTIKVKNMFCSKYTPKIAEKAIIGIMVNPAVLFTTWGIHLISNKEEVGISYNSIDFSRTTVTRTDQGEPRGTYLRLKGKDVQFYIDVSEPENFLELLYRASMLHSAASDTIESIQDMPSEVKFAYGKLLLFFCQNCELDLLETIRFTHDLQMDTEIFKEFTVYAFRKQKDTDLKTLIDDLKSVIPYPNEESITYALIQSMVSLIQFSTGRCRGITVREANYLDEIANMLGLSKEVVDKLIPVAQIPYRILKCDITEKEISMLCQGLVTVAGTIGVSIATVLGSSILSSAIWWFNFIPGIGTIITVSILGVVAITKLFDNARKKKPKCMEKPRQEQLNAVKKSYLSFYQTVEKMPNTRGLSFLVLQSAEKIDSDIADYIQLEIQKK